MKKCSRCKIWKSIEEFSKQSRLKDGRRYWCKSCESTYNKQKKIDEPDKWKEYFRNWWLNHKDWDRNRRDSNPEYVKQRHHNYYENNKDKFYEKVNNRKAKIKEVGGTITNKEWKELCNKYGNRCLRCGRKVKLTIDHIIPLSKGGSNTIDNIQPLCGHCNPSKGAKTIDYR
jgi:5-methylcytosine-specific restriction endonuclease McrA